jgi:ppGpp synthetase/RelA/SpoT-type nucleotidyltranferase
VNERDYQILTHGHSRVLEQLKLRLSFYLEDMGPASIIAIESRIKTWSSAFEKSRSLGIAIEELDDLAGLRVVVGTSWEAQSVAEFFAHPHYAAGEFEVLKNREIESRGYRARHVVVGCSTWYTGITHSLKAEIQIQTVFQHAYNALSRSWVYKNTAQPPEDWERRFGELSSRLRDLEVLADDLHRSLPSSALAASPTTALTPMLFREIVKAVFKEEISYSDAVSTTVWLRSLGVNTAVELRTFLERTDIEQLWGQAVSLSQSHDDYLRGTGDAMTSKGRFGFWFGFGIKSDWLREHFAALRAKIASSSNHSSQG